MLDGRTVNVLACVLQEAYVQLATFQLTLTNLAKLFFQSAQQAIISEPVCRLLESLLYGKGGLTDKSGTT
jgi:hypothetical protein